MRFYNSVVSSLRESFAAHRENRAQSRNTEILLSADLSPSARQEIMAILARGNSDESPVPAPRRATVRQPVGAGV